MAQRHLLSVEVIPSNNDKSLHLFDASEYVKDFPVDCPRLEITIPGFNLPKVITPVKGFNLSLNAISLKLVSPSSTDLPPLQDGIYIIKYSISPNEKVWVEYNYLKDTSLQNKIYKYRCKLNLSTCAPDKKTYDSLLELREIEDYIKAAKAKVEFCGEPEEGMALFNYAKKLLDKLGGVNCC